MKKVFIETANVQQFRRAVGMAEDTEKGRPGMVAVWGEAGSGKTEAAQMLYEVGRQYRTFHLKQLDRVPSV